MGKILTRAERAETEFPSVLMAASVTNMALPKSPQAWLKGNGYKHDTVPETQKSLTQCDLNDDTQAVTPTKENTIEEYVNEDSTEHGRKREVDSLPLESFSDDWWNHSISCEEDFQPYDLDQAEEPPYWLNYEPTDNIADEREANTCFNNTNSGTESDITEQDTTSKLLHVQGLKDENNTSTKTEEKIQSLRALLAEQEKAINRLKNESRERNFEPKEFLTSLKEDKGYCLGKPVFCENERDVSVKSHHDLITCKNGFYKVRNRSPTCKGRKRMGTERTTLPNTKRFRYNFRKDIPLDVNSYLDRKTDETVTLLKEKFTFEYVKADIRKEAFTQDEFLSFLGLVRTATRCRQEMV
ncbi:hypothetical protein ACROYT_G019189 [Oculina patagonica]